MTGETNLPLKLRLFGPFEARLNGLPLPALRSRKGQHLLALLALRSGKDIQREWLAQTIWPDHLFEEALGSLRQSLSDLRKALGASRDCILSPTPRTLQLDSEKAAVDVLNFDQLAALGDGESLERAIGLYRGALLEGWTEPWILPEREGRQDAYLGALATLASSSTARGDDREAIRYLRLAAAADPLRQETHRRLMGSLVKAGDEGAALQVYADLRHLLHVQYGAEPEEETYRLHRAIRESIRRRLQVRQAPTGLKRPEASHAGATDGKLQKDTFAGAALQERASGSRVSIPRPLTALLGREVELRELEMRLFSSRLVTVVGTGGVGKTRLALQAASETATEYEHGVYFVDLASLTNPEAVPTAIVSALGLGEERDQSPLQRLLDYLRRRHLLLVLDNCEHLIGACAEVAQALLRGCGRLRVLATSRERLGITGEVVRTLPPLPLPAGSEIPEAALQSPAVQLFVERAGAVCSTFTLTPDSTGDVVNICRRLDGIPLAIELAAPLVTALSPAQILERLDDCFRPLTEGGSAGPERHRSLHAMMDSSYTLLSEGEKTLLGQLSVFAGGWTLEAAEAVCDLGSASSLSSPPKLGGSPPTPNFGGEHRSRITIPLARPTIFSLLSGLIGKSLVIAEEGESGLRYRMLQTIRDYAAERLLERGELEAVMRRHQLFYAALSEKAEPQLTGPNGALWLRRLDREVENFRATLNRTPPNPPLPRGGIEGLEDGETFAIDTSLDDLRLAGALGRFWLIRGEFSEGQSWLTKVLSHSPGRTEAHAKALTWAGMLTMYQGDYAAARRLYEQSLHIWQELGSKKGMGGVLGCLGIAAKDRGNLQAALELFTESLKLAQETGDRLGAAGSLGYLGIIHTELGNYPEARRFYEKSLSLRQELEDRWGIAASLNNLGLLARFEGDLQQATLLLEECLSIRRLLGDRRCIAITLNILGGVAQAGGDHAEAFALCKESLAIAFSIGDRRTTAYSLESFANFAAASGRAERAARLYGAAEKLRETIGSPLLPGERERLQWQGLRSEGPDDSLNLQTAWDLGQKMTTEEALEFAMNDTTGEGSA